MKHLFLVMVMFSVMFGFTACGDKQESNLTDGVGSNITYSEDENGENNNLEQEEDTDDSDKEVNKEETCWISGSSVNFRKTPNTKIGLGRNPEGHKQREGDGRTPEGEYYVCVKNHNSSFYLSLGVSYPNKVDAAAALEDGRIDRTVYNRIVDAIDKGQQPDWYTPLGGEIMIHGHGGSRDWTAGCIAVDNEVMDILFEYCSVGTKITILP